MQDKTNMTDEAFVEMIIREASSPEQQALAEAEIAAYKASGAAKYTLDLREHDILKLLNVSYIAQRFFGRSRSWMWHKINQDVVNGRTCQFTPEERDKLRLALETVAEEIQEIAESL